MTVKLLVIPFLDRSRANLLLPTPSKFNTGGFRLACSEPVYEYSPIDIAVCGLETLKSDPIRDLNRWFLDNPSPRFSEQFIIIGLLVDEQPIFKTVLAWRLEPDNRVRILLRKLAPFTFRS